MYPNKYDHLQNVMKLGAYYQQNWKIRSILSIFRDIYSSPSTAV